MKTQLAWSGTGLCAVIGIWVWCMGGWGSVASSIKPIKLVRTVWVTNEFSVSKQMIFAHDVWKEPLKPIDSSKPEMFIPWEGHRIPNPQYFTNNFIYLTNSYITNFFNPSYITNVYLMNGLSTNWIGH